MCSDVQDHRGICYPGEGLLFIVSVSDGIALPTTVRHNTGDIYDIHGRIVRQSDTNGVPASTEGLPAGIYIRNGRKIIVK